MIAVLFITFFLLLAMGAPIVFTLGISSLVYLFIADIPLALIPQKMVVSLDNFIFVALPLFILTGELMNSGGITRRLINLANVFVSRFRGGLAYVNILTSMLFGGVQGLAAADTAAVGKILIPAMEKEGYTVRFAAAITVCTSTIGAIIPPSLLMIVYASVAEISVGGLFLGGMIPGMMIVVSQMALVAFLGITPKYRAMFPEGRTIGWADTKKYAWEGLPTLSIPVIIVVGITWGFFTATEAAGIAVVVAVFLGLSYKEVKVKDLFPILMQSAKLSGSLMLILGTASLFAFILTSERVPHHVGEFLVSLTGNIYVLLLLLNVFLLIVGTFMDPTPSIIILTPILAPILTSLGMHEIHIGIFLTINLIIGLTTPPVGTCLFIASAISGESIERISLASLPFQAVNIMVLMAVTYLPFTVLFLPGLAGYLE